MSELARDVVHVGAVLEVQGGVRVPETERGDGCCFPYRPVRVSTRPASAQTRRNACRTPEGSAYVPAVEQKSGVGSWGQRRASFCSRRRVR